MTTTATEFALRLPAWRARAQTALTAIEARAGSAERARVIALLTQAHGQVRAVLASAIEADTSNIPWEFARGLDLLDLSGVQSDFPATAEALPTSVLKDGSLLGIEKYELLDPLWLEAVVEWLEHYFFRAANGTTPQLITMNDAVVIAIAGDWGTGAFESDAPAPKVAKAMLASPVPDFTLHVGDVYYAGTDTQERNNMAQWPQGKLPGQSGTLNSNHEMYNGMYGYCAELSRTFPMQKNTSYFALQNAHWLIIALDSAIAAPWDKFYMDGQIDAVQCSWLASLPKGKRVIVLSHHQPYDITGSTSNVLYTQFVQAFGSVPDYWYWGHLHNGIVYAPKGNFNGRCIGHGAIPYGIARELGGNAKVLWYEQTNACDPDYPDRVLNGFVKITLNGTSIVEQMMAEDGSQRWSS